MQEAIIRLSEGYGELRAGKLAQAMRCFVETLETYPELANVTASNIRQTQRYHQKQARTGTAERLLIVPHTGTQVSSAIPARIQEGATGKIVLQDNAFELHGQWLSFSQPALGNALAHFAVQHPASYLYDAVVTPESVLLGCFYRLLWRAQVSLALDQNVTIPIDDYLEHFADPVVLAHIATYLQPGNLAAIEHLGRSPKSSVESKGMRWPRPYARMGQIDDQLMAGTDEQFLLGLFGMVMDRPPQPNEHRHYKEHLQKKPNDRHAIVQLVCQSKESQQRMREVTSKTKHTPRVYPHPQIGDLTHHDIDLPHHANPKVSVLIPVYGKVEYTLACLKSIADYPPKTSFEVIVMDDGSQDGSAQILQSINNVHLIVNSKNLGFLRSCNNGARHAKGEYLLFLNNDTQVQPGWLDELVATFSSFPGCGLAGSKLIYPDGSLQEAGGIIWQDGSAWNYGNRQDSALPIFNYAREVDYVSGAAILVPSVLFSQLGGFDDIYAPAYCEDADLALKIRDHGYRVIYQPLSQVVHFEGITAGTDTRQGVKAYQVKNSQTLHQRWKARLAKHRPNGQEPSEEKDRAHTMRALVIDHCTPTPNQDAGSLTVYNLMLLMREMHFQVTFIPEDNFLPMRDYTSALQRMGIEALYAPYVTSVEQHLREDGTRYDLAFLFRPGVVERHAQTIRQYCPNAKVLYHTVDLHFLRMAREARLQADATKQQAANEMQERELAAIRSADASIVHSTVELEILRPQLPDATLHVFPLILDVQSCAAPLAERSDIVFVGGYQHTPNVDAVHYFVAEVMPLLRKQLPGICFYVVGSKPPADIEALAAKDIIVTGFVEELTPLLDKMRVSIAPLRYGAGIKGKIGTAMAVGLPVVATSMAAEGMSLTHGDNILIADGAQAFAEQVVNLYQDAALWHTISQNGLMFAENAWGVDAAWDIFETILQSLKMYPVRQYAKLRLYASTPLRPSKQQPIPHRPDTKNSVIGC